MGRHIDLDTRNYLCGHFANITISEIYEIKFG